MRLCLGNPRNNITTSTTHSVFVSHVRVIHFRDMNIVAANSVCIYRTCRVYSSSSFNAELGGLLFSLFTKQRVVNKAGTYVYQELARAL